MCVARSDLVTGAEMLKAAAVARKVRNVAQKPNAFHGFARPSGTYKAASAVS